MNKNVLIIYKQDRIFMENVGAVKELSKITSNLEARICELEQSNKRHSLLKNDDPGIALSNLSSKYSKNLFT